MALVLLRRCLQWGDPENLKDYEGGRTYDDLKKHLDDNQVDVCGPANLDKCSDDKKASIAKVVAMPESERDAAIEAYDTTKAKHDAEFKALVEKLTEQYVVNKKKTEDVKAAVKAWGIAMAKNILSDKRSKK